VINALLKLKIVVLSGSRLGVFNLFDNFL